jgi:hypothetical protein
MKKITEIVLEKSSVICADIFITDAKIQTDAETAMKFPP